MSLWDLQFLFPLKASWAETEEALAKHIVAHGGSYDGGDTRFQRREVFGTFKTKKEAEECGKAAYYLYVPYLSWSVAEIKATS